MTDVASAPPSAGWYDDPSDSERLRWWDGSAWTENARPKPAAPPTAPAAPPMGAAYTVDENRPSGRRAARATEPDASEERLAAVIPLRPSAEPAGAEPLPQSAEPQPVVPPTAESRAAADPVLPALGPVPQVVDGGASPVVATGTPADGIPVPGDLVGGPDPASDERPEPAAPGGTDIVSPTSPEAAAALAHLAQRAAEARSRSDVPAASSSPVATPPGTFLPGSGSELRPAFVPDFTVDGSPIPAAPEPAPVLDESTPDRHRRGRTPKLSRRAAQRAARQAATAEPSETASEPTTVPHVSAEATPVQQAPVQQAPAQDLAVQDPVLEDSPAEDDRVEEPALSFASTVTAPVEQAPVETPEPTDTTQVEPPPEPAVTAGSRRARRALFRTTAPSAAPAVSAASTTEQASPESSEPVVEADTAATTDVPAEEQSAPAPVASAAPGPLAAPASAAAPAPVSAPIAAPAPIEAPVSAPIAAPAPFEAPVSAPMPAPSGVPLMAPPATAPVAPAAMPAPATPAVVVTPSGAALPASPAELAVTPARPARRVVTPSDTPWWQGLTPSRSTTGPAWLLAFTPLFSLGALAAALWIALHLPAYVAAGAIGAALVVLVLPLILVALDAKGVAALGWQARPRTGLILLGWFAYLIGRQMRLRGEGARGSALLVVTVVVAVLAVAAVGYGLWAEGEQLRAWAIQLRLRYL